MRYVLFFTLITVTNSLNAQHLDYSKLKAIEYQLDDVMEIIDTSELKVKLEMVEREFQQEQNELNKARLGIIYHEVALNLSFLAQTSYKGYAAKSYKALTELQNSKLSIREPIPFIASYRASALSLMSAETRKLSLLGDAFNLFDEAVKKYSDICYAPEFLRGSVSENLPFIFFNKRKYAKKDFQSIIDKQKSKQDYANWKIMSFTYWAWANQHKGKKDRNQALKYLDEAIRLDPNYKAGRQRAEDLKRALAM